MDGFEQFKQQVRDQVDIVRMIGEYVRLKKVSGNRYQGLCPFHTEKSPSFSVWADIQGYKCFGCGEAGDLFTFVQKIEAVSFFEGLKMLAERNGIPVPKRNEYSDPDVKLRAALFQMHEIALSMFTSGLRSGNGQPAREYLSKRGLTPGQVEEFGIGLSDPNGQLLARRFQQEGFAAEHLEVSGLCRRRDDGAFYDSFRGRLMFPIHDESGRVVAFAGRTLKAGDDGPKYINSAATPIYQKSRVLYNLNRAKTAIRKFDHSILVEGYMDVIGVYSAEVHEVVASCGTALTNEQVRSMKRHSGRVVVNFDPDNAGANAAERSIQMLLEEGIHVRILELDGDLDPDEFIKEHGAGVYREKLGRAAGWSSWMLDRVRGRFDMNSAEGRMEGFQSLVPTIQKVNDKLEQLTIANEMASYLRVDAGAVLEQFRRQVRDRKAPPKPKPLEVPAPERLLLRIILRNTEARDEVLSKITAANLMTKRILEAIAAVARPGVDLAFTEVDDRLDEPNKALLHALAFADDTDVENLTVEQAISCIDKLEPSRKDLRRSELRGQVKQLEREGRIGEAIVLMGEMGRLERGED